MTPNHIKVKSHIITEVRSKYISASTKCRTQDAGHMTQDGEKNISNMIRASSELTIVEIYVMVKIYINIMSIFLIKWH